MKKLDIAKTIQLIVFLILTLASIDLVLLDPELYHMAGSDTRVRFLCGVLWLVLLLSFVFLLTDFILLSSYSAYRNNFVSSILYMENIFSKACG